VLCGIARSIQRKNKLEGESVANRLTSIASKLLQIINIKLLQKALVALLEYQTIDIYWVGTEVRNVFSTKISIF